jgi:hypothetical protein
MGFRSKLKGARTLLALDHTRLVHPEEPKQKNSELILRLIVPLPPLMDTVAFPWHLSTRSRLKDRLSTTHNGETL